MPPLSPSASMACRGTALASSTSLQNTYNSVSIYMSVLCPKCVYIFRDTVSYFAFTLKITVLWKLTSLKCPYRKWTSHTSPLFSCFNFEPVVCGSLFHSQKIRLTNLNSYFRWQKHPESKSLILKMKGTPPFECNIMVLKLLPSSR
jgi:uncharacterized C2H2 Zn-finger protein